MSKQFTGKFLRDDGETEIEVRFTITPGDPGAGPSYVSGGHPPSEPEVEIDRAWFLADLDCVAISLTAEEAERIAQEIAEGDEFDDDGPDPDDARDRLIDDRLMGLDL